MANSRLKVLVVDDDIQDFVLITEALKAAARTNFEVAHADSFERGRLAVQNDGYDVYLIDYFLDSDNGAELIKEASRVNNQKPMIVLTGADQADLDDKLIEIGAADFLPKNELAPALLERTIRHAIERKQSEARLARMVKQDALTGLGNRQHFEENIERTLARAKRNGSRFAVIFLDLDRFKEVNDTLGHHVGDLLLTAVADRLTGTTRDSDLVARISGDEFTLLLDDINATEDAVRIAEKLLAVLSAPTVIQNTTLNISASLGIATFPDNGATPTELMQKADMALYESKKRGAGHYRFFTEDMQARLEHNIGIEQGLRQALNRDEFRLYFQPQWRLSDNRMIGVEALIRWHRHDSKVISPAEFIPVAEKTGLIHPIGEWVIDRACRYLKRLNEIGAPALSVAINLSAKQLRRGMLTEQVASAIAMYGINASQLELELTEGSFIETGEEMRTLLTELKSRGVSIAIDDFGTGYSSMRYLKHFPVDRLKIDKSFVSGAGSAIAEPAITVAITTLAQSLNLDVVAEGVETAQQVAALRETGCPCVQGFYFAKPMGADDLLAFLSV